MSQTTDAQDKQALRSEIRRLKRLQRSEALRAWSEKICSRVLELTEWQQARTVLLYAALPPAGGSGRHPQASSLHKDNGDAIRSLQHSRATG